MNLHALRIFEKVTVTGSVTRAAEVMNISQPAVTAQIRNLEKELGMVLLAPKGRGILLTEAGETLAEYAQRLFSLEKEIESNIADFQAGRSGKLRIVATYLPANLLLPEWVAKFKQRHESVEVVLTTANYRGAFDQLLNYQAEVAVYGGGWDEQPGIVWDELFEDELWFIVPKHHRLASQEITLTEMMKEPFILREEGSSTRDRLFSLCRAFNVNPPNVALQFNGLNETIRAVMAGYGANFISALAVREYVQRGDVARVYVKGVDLKNPIAICTRKGEKLSPQAGNFVKMIKQSVGKKSKQ
jgi:DNA-binding transcriptional LysR family regulator